MNPTIIEVNVPDSPGDPVEISQPISNYLIIQVSGEHNNQNKRGIKLINNLRLGDHVRIAYKQGSNGSGQCYIYDKDDTIVGLIINNSDKVFSIKLSDNWYGW